jgi:hypothetical protein
MMREKPLPRDIADGRAWQRLVWEISRRSAVLTKNRYAYLVLVSNRVRRVGILVDVRWYDAI